MFKDSKKKYEVVRQAISYELANFIFNYFLLHREATAFLLKQQIISDTLQNLWGTWKDPQAPNTFSKYGDGVMETLLMRTLPMMSKLTGLNLIPCYAYARIYKKGDILARHKDRNSCETSCTINLGGDPWNIFIDPSGKTSVKKSISKNKVILKKRPAKGIPILLKPGDMMVYCGQHIEHWRKPFKGNICAQLFLDYNNKDGPYGQENFYDGRPVLGIPKIRPR